MLKEIGKKALLAAEELKTIDTDTKNKVLNDMASEPVSYTHLTLPTKA